MTRKWIGLFVCLPLMVIGYQYFMEAQTVAAIDALRVDEKRCEASLRDGRLLVSLGVDNIGTRAVTAQVEVELLDPAGNLRSVLSRTETIRPGAARVALPISLKQREEINADDFIWYRLRYRLTPRSQPELPASGVEGIISLSELKTEYFILRATAAERARAGTHYRVRTCALNPLTRRPVSGVTIEGAVSFDSDPEDIVIKSKGQTDRDGCVLLDFALPEKLPDDYGDIEIKGRLNNVVQQIRENGEIKLDEQALILINTDKPLYQPGQVMHVRTLIFDTTRAVIAGARATLKITDPENGTAFSAQLQTSPNGIASVDWPIPAGTRLGTYLIAIDMEDSKYEDSRGTYEVKISRYELPNFTVTVKPDRPYYRPGENASVTVSADYLFGKPVTRGRVRLVRETERRWNYQLQKYESAEGERLEGECDLSGKYLANIDLSEAHNELATSTYLRFRDLTYAAYLTDPTTNRTEQRRFNLRVTRDDIHIYVLHNNNTFVNGLNPQFYISTFYADGTPAKCQVKLNYVADAGANASDSSRLRTQMLKTNRYGIAKVSDLQIKTYRYGQMLVFKAEDEAGRSGQHSDQLWNWQSTPIRIDTDKTIYRAGEPIVVKFFAPGEEGMLFIDLLRETGVIRSELVKLKNGHGELFVPYRNDMKGEITIAAYKVKEADDYYARGDIGMRTVIYPHNQDLKVNVKMSRSTYQPGEEAEASFRVRGPDGQPVAGALGIVVFDKAVEERVRTDQEFSGSYGFRNAYSFLYRAQDEIAGITRADLNRLDPAQLIPPELDLTAEILLNLNNSYTPFAFGQEVRAPQLSGIFYHDINNRLAPVKTAINRLYDEQIAYALERERAANVLSDTRIDLTKIVDPWGVPYRPAYSVKNAMDVIEFVSAGPDKQFGNSDDFVADTVRHDYFQPVKQLLDRAVARHHSRTGRHIVTVAKLRDELMEDGIDLANLRDRWGNLVRVKVNAGNSGCSLAIMSAGPDGRFQGDSSYSWDDYALWATYFNPFSSAEQMLRGAMRNRFFAGDCPQTLEAVLASLKKEGIDREQLTDPWGNPYYFQFRDAITGDYRFIFDNYARTLTGKDLTTPKEIVVRSRGLDGREGTLDDIEVAKFSCTPVKSSRLNQFIKPASYAQVTGAIRGIVKDESGAVISGAYVIARHKENEQQFEATSNENGEYLLQNLPLGLYSVQISAEGFQHAGFNEVPVFGSNITQINAILRVGTTSDVVEVTAGGADRMVQTTTQSIKSVDRRSVLELSPAAKVPPASSVKVLMQTSTPRLREEFAETLVWQPELVTSGDGRAKMKFKLADNITTWKIAIIGSTANGRIGTAEKEFTAFQPFFIELEPPRVLTEGDEISLPVVLRNYLENTQNVKVELSPAEWFAPLGALRKRATIPAGDAAKEYFDLRAVASVEAGKQRVTATGGGAGDAIEKRVSVHPDGEEMVDTNTRIFTDYVTIDQPVPDSAIKGSLKAELKIYPNLMAHALEGIEGILKRPYGCGEQTISSTYPNLMVLRYLKQNEISRPEVSAQARRYLQEGYERLLGYREPGGGFSYWGRGDANLALSAYALRFLVDARDLIEIDAQVVESTRQWLERQQRAEGSWQAYQGRSNDASKHDLLLTSYITQILARTGRSTGAPAPTQTVQRALKYLTDHLEKGSEPYALATVALAAHNAGAAPEYARAVHHLRESVSQEQGMNYWELNAYTPFYGWGLAGRIETTALAVQALLPSAADAGLMTNALLYLLKHKDRYGVWYSTQATINVLDALIQYPEQAGGQIPEGRAEVVVNGQPVTAVKLPVAKQLSHPIAIDISKYVATGINRIEVRQTGGRQSAAQIVTRYYLPWSENVRKNKLLQLDVDFDRTACRVGEELVCRVRAERTAANANGMMLAEIGLPPGAEVDRASLEQASKELGWALNHYEILPDRVIAYLWPRGGGIDFQFKFRLRYAIKAKAAASVLYDYYNPEARTTVAPVKFHANR